MTQKVSITLVGDDWQKAVAVSRNGEVLHLLHPIQGAQTIDLSPDDVAGVVLHEVDAGFDGQMVGVLPPDVAGLSLELVDVPSGANVGPRVPTAV